MIKEQLIRKLIEIEGGYSNDPSDSGGETKFGITKEVARKNNYLGDMEHLPYSIAEDIYSKKYWKPLQGDTIAELGIKLIEELFDSAVNCGVYRTIVWLQRCLNLLNNVGKYYADIKVDGKLGNKTLQALKACIDYRKDTTVLLRMLNSIQGYHYINLAENRIKDEKFIYGWFLNRVTM